MLLNYLILSTGRSRSGVLAHYLRNLKCGLPDEFFEVARFDLLKTGSESQMRKQVGNFLDSKRDNGILGMRMVWSHARRMSDKLGMGIKEFADTYFPDTRYIFFKRNPLMQAVEGRVYDFKSKGIDPRKASPADILKSVSNRVWQIVVGYQAWEEYFRHYDIDPLRIYSEDLAEDPANVCKEIFEFLGLPYPDITLKDNYNDSTSSNPSVSRFYNICIQEYL